MARPLDPVTLLLTGGLGVVGILTLGPAVMPRTSVPAVTHAPLPPVQASVNGEPPTYPTTKSVEPLISGRLNINSASKEQLEALSKVGPTLAQRIMDHRPYRNLADLDAVKGMGETTLRVLEPLISFQ